MPSLYESITLLNTNHIAQYYEEQTGEYPEVGKHYKCIMPGHKEDTPSMVFYGTHFYCFGACKKRIDIFTLASIFEKKPIRWYEGYTKQNVNYLLAKYGYITVGELDEEEGLRSLVLPYAADFFKAELRNGLSYIKDEDAHRLGIGILDDPNALMISVMETYHITEEDVYRVLNPIPFGTDKLTYLVSDHLDRPAGFISRNLSYEAEMDRASKGEKIKTTKYLWCGIFKDDKVPYGLSDISTNKDLPTVLVESPKTKAFTKAHGVPNILAVCGSTITKSELDRILSVGVKSMVFCFDNDNAGRLGVASSMESFFKENIWFDLRVVDWPENIPERANIEDVAEKFNKRYAFDCVNNTVDVYTFLHKHFGSEKYEICAKFASINSLEGVRSKHAIEISKVFGMNPTAVRNDIERIKKEADKRRALYLAKEMEQESQKLQVSLNAGKISPLELVSKISRPLERFNTANSVARDYEQHTVIDSIEEVLQENENRNYEKKVGWETGMWFFDEAMEGLPKSQSTIVFGASANVGKSAFVVNLVTNMLQSENNQDLHICLVTNDDSLKKTVPKFIARLSKLNSTWCKHVNRYITRKTDKELYQSAVNEFRGFINPSNPKLSIYDVSTIQTENQCMDLVKHIQDTYNKKVILVIDNFHNILIPQDQTSTTSREHLITTLHNSTIALDYTLMITAEIRKLDPRKPKARPVAEDLKDSIRLGYVPTIVALLWSSWWAYGHPDYSESKEDILYWEDPERGKQPILECYIDKNKADMVDSTANKITLYYKNIPDHCYFQDIDINSPEVQHTKQKKDNTGYSVRRKDLSDNAPTSYDTTSFNPKPIVADKDDPFGGY